ncbi:hypothetical protein NB689_003444 [Xanthomonas sacchari]|nr:hypothetical protein [Xanthomonas sacchari]
MRQRHVAQFVGQGEDAALLGQHAVRTPARERAVLDDAHFQHVRPALAHARTLDPRQALDRVLRILQAHREETAPRIRQHHLAQLLGGHALEIAAHLQPAQRPALGPDPAVEHGHDRQRDQGKRQQPGEDAQGGVHARTVRCAGMGNREWGMGKAQAAAHAAPLLPIPDSRFPIPGVTASAPGCASTGRRNPRPAAPRPWAPANGWSCPGRC